MTRSRNQLETTARNLMSQALANGWSTEALMVDHAVQHMGEDMRPLVQRAYDKHFRAYPAN